MDMAQVIKIKIRPGQVARFPGICVHCSQTAVERLPLKKRIGRITRLIDLPVCAACTQELNRISGEEERLQKIGRLSSLMGLILLFILLLVLLPAGLALTLRLMLATTIAIAAAAVIHIYFKRAVGNAARPEKQAIRSAARMITFSWRATTFEFTNDSFAQQFADMNRSLLMET